MQSIRLFALFIVSSLMMLFVACSGNGKKGTTKSGFPYVMHISTGGAKAKAGDVVEFQVVTRAGDSVMYSSYDQPPMPKIPLDSAMFASNKNNPVIDALMLMAVGDSVTVEYFLDSMPAQQRPPGMDKVKSIFYDVKMVNIIDASSYEKMQAEEKEKKDAEMAGFAAQEAEIGKTVAGYITDHKSNKYAQPSKSLEPDFKIMSLSPGEGELIKAGDKVTVQYYGALTSDGTKFDSSYGRGEPATFAIGVGQVIPGWDKGIVQMKKGEKAVLFIPWKLAYGEEGRGPIPAKADLTFLVEILDVERNPGATNEGETK